MNYKGYVETIIKNNEIPISNYLKNGIVKGLRQRNGNGILLGYTNISEVYGRFDGNDCKGKIFYRGIDLETIVSEREKNIVNGYEEILYLLLIGRLPSSKELELFEQEKKQLYQKMEHTLEDIINQETGINIMNSMAKSVLKLYDFDKEAENISIENMLRQAVELSYMMSILSANIYRKYNAPDENISLILDANRSCAENILYILRERGEYTVLEAEILDLCMVLHAELGAGNNSAFTTQVVSSAGSDTYSVISSAICSIKGPKHGGANMKTFLMFRDMQKKITNLEDDNQIKEYLKGIIRKEQFDGSGLIYGVGHAVFTVSDPRALILKKMAKELAKQKNREAEFRLYELVEYLAPKAIKEEKGIDKQICINVDYYTGFIYDMLGIPMELFTPMFVNARIAGWCAHRIEEMCNDQRIMHPQYICESGHKEYVKIKERKMEEF